jgi:PAS domain S-box-containing protein
MSARYYVCWLLCWLLPLNDVWAEDTLRLGILAFRPKPVMEECYLPLTTYLSTMLQDVQVELHVLTQEEIELQLAEKQLDLLMTNPSHYLQVRSNHHISGALATVMNQEDGQAVTQLGGVIITAAHRHDITQLQHLKRKRIAVPGINYLGGYQTQVFELKRVGIHLPMDAQILEVGRHDAVTNALLAGKADVGFVRTGILEDLIAKGLLDPTHIKVIHQQHPPNFPFYVSTQLYPEWPFLALPHVHKNTVRRITAALLALEPDHPAAHSAKIAGFAPPLDYLPVEQLAQALRLPPFDKAPVFTFKDVWQKYWLFFLILTFTMIIIAFLLVLLARRNQELHASEMRLRTLIATEPECIKIVSKEGILLQMNPAGLAMIEAEDLTQVAGQPVLNVIAPEYRTAYAQLHQNVMNGKKQRLEYEVIGIKGGRRWLETHAVLFQDKDTAYHLAVTRDISMRKSAEQKLSEREAIFRAVFENAAVGIAQVAPNGQFLQINQKFCQIIGYSCYEILQQHFDFQRITYADDLKRDIAEVTRLLKGAADNYCIEKRYIHKDGHIVWITLSVQAMRDEHGKVLYFISAIHDITARKRTEDALQALNQQFVTLLENTSDFIYFKDKNGRFLFCSQTLAQLTQHVSWRDMRGKHDFEVFSSEIAQIYAEEEISVLNGKALLNKTSPYIDTNGNKGWVNTCKWPVCDKNGTVVGLFGISRDITTFIKTQESLQQAKEQAEAANRTKSAFLANMSHELRTPLNAIMGFAQILTYSNDLPEAYKRHVESIYNSGNYLLSLINDILDLAKVEAGRIELFPEDIAIQDFMQDVVEMFRFRADNKGIGFDYHAKLPECLHVDPKRLRQILANLLGNAVKFTEQGQVRLIMQYDAGILHIQVQDSGPGIDSAQHHTIFLPFSQTGESRYKVQGTGLGLAITRTIVELMQGHIHVNSTPGQGSCFEVTLPLAPCLDSAPAPYQETGTIIAYTSGKTPLRILIVDDQEDNSEVLAALLQPLGFMIAKADSGEACLALVQTWQAHLVLMDLRMPGMDGLETTRRLHQLPNYTDLPVIAISASAYAEDREASRLAGCVSYLTKPVERCALLQTLAAHLPLTWIYTAAPAAPPTPTGPPLCASQIQEIMNFLHAGDLSATINYLENLIQQPDCPPEAPKLLRWAQDYKLNELRQYLYRRNRYTPTQ